MRMERSGADAICAALDAAGVDTVFGVPGTQTVALYESLRRSRLRTVTATSETAAAFMAQGFYRASGRLAAVSAIPGPGFAYTLAALAEARLDSAALVLLTGRPADSADGRPRAQAIDQRAIARPLVKEVMDVGSAVDAGATVLRACALAVAGEPGPVIVQFAPGVYSGNCSDVSPFPLRAAHNTRTGPEQLRDAARFLASAGRVLIYAGQGAAGAAESLGRLAVTLNALVATTPSGRGILPEDDPRLLPFDATGDVEALNAIAAECDAILAIGAGFAENGSAGFALRFAPEALVRVDTSADVLARPPAARVGVVATAEAFAEAALDEAARHARVPGTGFDGEAAIQRRLRFKARPLDTPSEARVAGGSARDFFAALRRAMPAGACLVLDSGLHQLLARRHFTVLAPRELVFPGDFQSMGFGLPAAIGAKLADPGKPVVALIGDGGLAMTGLELATAARLRLPLPVVVFDDGALGLIRLDQILTYGKGHATELGGLDYRALADAVSCQHAHVDIRGTEAAIRRALAANGATLIVLSVGDAPALRRARATLLARGAVKSLLGPRLIATYRRLRARWRSP